MTQLASEGNDTQTTYRDLGGGRYLATTPIAMAMPPQPKTDNDTLLREVYRLIGKWVVVTQTAQDGSKKFLIARHAGIGYDSLCLYPLQLSDADPVEAAHIPESGWTVNGPLSRGQVGLNKTGPLLRDEEGNIYDINALPDHLIPVCEVNSKNRVDENLGDGPRTQWQAARRF